ncbi:hypothetical protein SISNIDRAFT_483083 [Sistotremastrum niveocremeum HHB9708]|uniref:JmjC domain-containing protein n=1 Tax=Sistotremastrum niveocremeum HHB9708 TaxID=1314777 RepID=A0A164Y2V0_9AGAM|nr:hypothetical protein SISNIDRAFT_483083 [Sistotremastrum niveocremeum HHB9708]
MTIRWPRVDMHGEVMRETDDILGPVVTEERTFEVRVSEETRADFHIGTQLAALNHPGRVRPAKYDPRGRHSPVYLSPRQWRTMVRHDREQAEGLVRDHCIVLLGFSQYSGPDGLDLEPEGESIGSDHTGSEPPEPSPWLVPSEATLHQLFHHLRLSIETERPVVDVTGRGSDSQARDQGTKMCKHDKLANMFDPRKFMNFLVLQGIHSAIPEELRSFIDTDIAANDGFHFQCADCGKPSWVIAAQDGVCSRGHADTGGCATCVHLLAGLKLWAVRVGTSMAREEDFIGDDPNLEDWEVIVLRPGDKLLMPPRTAHAVYSLTRSVARGSVYYLANSYDHTLFGMLEEHVAGLAITNTADPAHTGHLFRLWMYYQRLWEVNEARPRPSDWPPTLPTARSLAGLTLILEHLKSLTPSMPYSPTKPPMWPDWYKHDRRCTRLALNNWLANVKATERTSPAAVAFLSARTELQGEYKLRLPPKSEAHRRPRDLWDSKKWRQAFKEGRVFYLTQEDEDEADREWEEECEIARARSKNKKVKKADPDDESLLH